LGDARLTGLVTSLASCSTLPQENWLISLVAAAAEDEVVVPEAEPNSSVGTFS
jgi:hypothetical protein